MDSSDVSSKVGDKNLKHDSPQYGAASGVATADRRPGVAIPAVCWLILVVELAERLVFYTLNGTQEFFLERLGIPLSRAAGLNATMSTLCTVWALGASWVADSKLGRATTILVSGLLYTAGVSLAAFAAVPGRESGTLYFIGTLGLLPIATAGIKANISNLGADQYDTSTPQGKQAQETFFSVFYLSINLGAGLAYGFFTTFASSGGWGVPAQDGYAVTYAIMAVCMLAAVGIFQSGRSSYRVQPLQSDSALGRTANLVVKAASAGSMHAISLTSGLVLLFVSIVISVSAALFGVSHGSVSLGAGLCAALGTVMVVAACVKTDWLQHDSVAEEFETNLESSNALASGNDQGLTDVQEVQQFLKIIPVLFTGTLAFFALYNSMAFWYQQQACQMNVRLQFSSGGSVMLSGSFFNLADCFAIVLVTPIVINFINPAIERAMGRSMTTGIRFAIGMAIGSASVIVATQLELWRRRSGILPLGSTCAPNGVNMSDIPAAWMALPYFLLGVAEVYSLVTIMHYCYSQCPASMRTLSTASFFFIQAVSTGVFTLETTAMTSYIPDDLNKGHLEYGYLLNLSTAGVLYAIFVLLLH